MRHPGYTGLIMSIIGDTIFQWKNNKHYYGLTFTFNAWFALGCVLRCVGEEGMLCESFGEEYEEYMEDTPYRLIPYLW